MEIAETAMMRRSKIFDIETSMVRTRMLPKKYLVSVDGEFRIFETREAARKYQNQFVQGNRSWKKISFKIIDAFEERSLIAEAYRNGKHI